MELDIIILKDGFYHQILVAENVIDCFDFCDELRERWTTYLDERNQHIIKSGKWGGGQWFGCICR